MKSKGFTLIELLAVIVILAIIALIATPIVLGIIEDSRESANRLSSGFIVDTVENAWSIAFTKNNGALPTLSQVKENFNMKDAEWKVVTEGEGEEHKIVTSNEQVTCNVEVKAAAEGAGTTKLQVKCSLGDEGESDDVISDEIEIAVETETEEQPEGDA